MHTLIRTIAPAVVAASVTVAASAGADVGAAVAGADAPIEPLALSSVCVAHGGSFHVNTVQGTNWICSAPRFLGSFNAERTICDRSGGTFDRTQVVDGRASWFCHTGE